MPVETLPHAPGGPHVEDSPEHSFPTAIRRAVDTLFTYQHIQDPLQAAPEGEDTAQFVELWKLGITAYLKATAKAAVATSLDALTTMRSGEPGETKAEGLVFDTYVIAEAAYGARVDLLQKSGELRKPSQITSEEEQEDYFDDLSKLYKETCLAMGLAWPPPLQDSETLPK